MMIVTGIIGVFVGMCIGVLVMSCMQVSKPEPKPHKCRSPDGIVIKPDGENELDSCIYKVIEEHENCTVRVCRCIRCGHTELEWERQGDDFF